MHLRSSSRWLQSICTIGMCAHDASSDSHRGSCRCVDGIDDDVDGNYDDDNVDVDQDDDDVDEDDVHVDDVNVTMMRLTLMMLTMMMLTMML